MSAEEIRKLKDPGFIRPKDGSEFHRCARTISIKIGDNPLRPYEVYHAKCGRVFDKLNADLVGPIPGPICGRCQDVG